MTDILDTAALPPAAAPRKTSIFHRLYHGETTFDYVGKRRYGFWFSAALITISLLSLFTRGLNLGIDFEGGVAWELPAKGVSTQQVDDVLSKNGIDPISAKIQTVSGPSGDRYRIQVAAQPIAVQDAVRADLALAAGVPADEVSLTSVGPTWGNEISGKAERALVIMLIVIAIYISIRFEWKMAVGALVAVVHDVLISVGIYSLFGFEVSPATVVAFLTILGFSLYDTIVVFDKVHENAKRIGNRATYADIVNLSMNQVLMRSINTSLAAVLPVLSLLIVGSLLMGAVALQDFALALLVGLITGSYSSIFIATPILAVLKEREPKYKAARAKLGRSSTDPAVVRAMAGIGSSTPSAMATVAGPAVAPRPVAVPVGLTHPPRPRKKKRRT